MKRLKFYRVEDGLKWGLYSSCLNPVAADSMNGDVSRHPNWYNDSKLYTACVAEDVDPRTYREDLWRFAFCSLQQLKFWIYQDHWREELHNLGFVVSVLEADGFHGDTQGVYLASTRVDIEKLSILEI